ncbi:MAG: PTS sugar transporter subunit IIA [Desulfobacca sp.]|uniref:PTS sugar transporter subunit IIA n=1 Tax=Desulfobacca sp. TaxID=2067990 RepID=UPI004049D623
MKIVELLHPDSIVPSLQATTKQGILEELAAAVVSKHANLDKNQVVAVLLERESLGSTGIGDHIAIPHGKLPQLDRLVIGFGRSLPGINFDSLDGKPAHLFFLLLAPENSIGLHLKALAKLSRMLKDSGFRRQLMEAPDSQTILQLIAAADQES